MVMSRIRGRRRMEAYPQSGNFITIVTRPRNRCEPAVLQRRRQVKEQRGMDYQNRAQAWPMPL
jgi:hypothetical protein